MSLIEELAQIYAQTDIQYPSLKAVTLAQWMLESGRGTSRLAVEHFNFGGLKWRNEMTGFATKVMYQASDGTDAYCKFASLEAYITGYWRFLGRSPYKGWESRTNTPEEFISFIAPIYSGDRNYISKIKNLIPEAQDLLNKVSAINIWIQQTEQAIYLMEGEFYLDKIPTSGTQGNEINITNMRNWFTSNIPPKTLKIIMGNSPEPKPKP
ncbi:MAG TPA: glucosaminidase domain-containing protein [Nostocaceae cyanobacterium]|nr:glucosaminidase domain-containing protein [Nostocaceae cyanobacterium]